MLRTAKGRSGHATLLIAPLMALLLTSCGGGGGGGGGGEGATSSTASTADAATAITANTAIAGASAASPAASTTLTSTLTPTPAATSPGATPAQSTNPATASNATTATAAGSGGSATPTAPTAAATSTTPPVTGQIIEYYGDSTIWGYGSGTGVRVATPAPAAFAAALPVAMQYDVRNEGVNGSTACQLLNGTDGTHPAWDTQMASSKASVVILNHAINDEWKEDLTTYRSCLATLSQKAKAHGKKVVFETPNPTRDSGPNSLDVYVNAMRAVAVQEGAPVIDQYKYLTDWLNGQSAYTICPDGLHPTDAVYIMKGKYAASVYPSLGL
jgi:lysophospholipase L1-like esterase